MSGMSERMAGLSDIVLAEKLRRQTVSNVKRLEVMQNLLIFRSIRCFHGDIACTRFNAGRRLYCQQCH